MVEHACRAAGFVPDVPFHANDFGVLAAFVAAGLGVAMVPELALGVFGPDVSIRPVADVPVTRRLYAAARRGGLERPALAAMVAALREAAAR
jgi:DNA-binding transcriptional LysR family regulator